MTAIIPINRKEQRSLSELEQYWQVVVNVFPDTVVATCSETIADYCDKIGANYVLSKELAVDGLKLPITAGVILGCDILIVAPFGSIDPSYTKLIDRISSIQEPAVSCMYQTKTDPSGNDIKMAVSKNERILYLSRNLIPHSAKSYKVMTNVFAMNKPIISMFNQLPEPTTEPIEILKVIEAGYSLYGVPVGPKFVFGR